MAVRVAEPRRYGDQRVRLPIFAGLAMEIPKRGYRLSTTPCGILATVTAVSAGAALGAC